MNNDDEAIEESDEGDFDDRELDYITDSGDRFIHTSLLCFPLNFVAKS